MRISALAGALLLVCGSAAAQPTTPAGPPLGPPKAFSEYGQPDIGAGLCKGVNPTQTRCTIPAMTAGRYVIEVAGTATADAAEASQAIAIFVGGQSCRGSNKAPWTVKTPRTFKFDCVVQILSDRPVPVVAIYQDVKATKDPKGPVVTFTRLPWDGVLSAQPVVPKQ
jgi:hypothetical protein